MTAWLVCDMDDGILRRVPTRRAGRDWALDMFGGVVLHRHDAWRCYEYILGLPGEDSGADIFVVRADRAEANGVDLTQEPLYPYDDDPFEAGMVYCDEQCSQVAHHVRYARRKIAEGSAERDDIRLALRRQRALILNGGYGRSARTLDGPARLAVFTRAGWRCERCGQALVVNPAAVDRDSEATIQHANGDSNAPEDLQAFCRACNNDDADSKITVVALPAGSPEAALARTITARIVAETPLRACDDPDTWAALQPAVRRANVVELADRAEVAEAGDDRDLPGFAGWTPGGTPIQDC